MNDYYRLLDAVEKYYGSGSDEWQEIALYGITSDKAESILKQVPEVNIVKNTNGKIRSYNFAPTENITPEVEQAVNSNVSKVIKSFEVPADTGIETVTTETGEAVKQMTFKSGMKQAGSFVFGEVAPAIAATATGITLGKTFDKLLYNVNPDFWDEHGMSTLNPDTWGDIIGTDTRGERVLNMILGTTPDGKTQAYLDQNALAYMTLWLNSIGVFNESGSIIKESDETTELRLKYKLPIEITKSGSYDYITTDLQAQGWVWGKLIVPSADGVYSFFTDLDMSNPPSSISNNYGENYIFASKTIDAETKLTLLNIRDGSVWHTTNMKASNKFTHNGKTVYFQALIGSGFAKFHNHPTVSDSDDYKKIAWLMLYGATEQSSIEGIDNQEDAKLPTITGKTVPDVLKELKEQYPDLWDKAISQDVVQPDGSVETYTYVPVAMPDIDEYGNPITSTSTQSNPQVQPETATKTLLDLITKIIQRDPPTNPPDTGDGDTPPVVPPSGSASSLYAIYNPTLSQINAFGAWLWSDDFVDQIKKLFNDPMQAIIGLHKVYATPTTGESQNIKVGYLDSGVSSKVVSNQYTTIDCGSVSLSEYFENVFDYEPYTKVHLYLPFIGIVPLSVGEVMRSTIHVVYHVDVLTGACLAEVKIKRDSAGGTLFQYSGNAAVQYPISSGSYMSIISGIMSIAGGIAGSIATGGAAMPVLLGAGASVGRMHTDISHSGNFSGNAGAMGIKKPYLIIDRPQTALAKNFSNYVGYPSNSTVTLSGCKGFTKVKEIHLENIPATNNELTDIEFKLKGGVII